MGVRAVVAVLAVAGAKAAHWAVIAAGSSGYMNYRHQADACHAYQIVKARGIPEDNIILLAYDDIAQSDENPFKGKLFNKPDPHGSGKDVYAGCNIDYKGKDVSPENFLNVLTGKGTGKVLKSTSEDEVFVYFTDHGAPGIIAFPSGELHKRDLQRAFGQMSQARMFKKLTFYLESCESGSMFEGLNVPGVYALSAANPHESSWGAYCGDEAVINGKNLDSCLGDLFSIAWLEDVDSKGVSQETLAAQFEVVKQRTNKSHVMQWGDTSFVTDSVSEFVGDRGNALALLPPTPWKQLRSGAVSTRQVDLHRLYTRYMRTDDSDERILFAEELQKEVAKQHAAEKAYMTFLDIAFPGDPQTQLALRVVQEMPENPDCELSAHQTFRQFCGDKFDVNSGFALQFHQVVVNVCAAIAKEGLNLDVVSAAQQACGAREPPALVV